MIRTKESKKNRIKQALNDPDAIKAERCRRSFFYFEQEFWPEVSNDEPKWNWHIPYLCGELSKVAYNVAHNIPNESDVIINIPPGTTKSLTASVMFPVWCWINWYWMKFIVTSYSGALALEQAEISRELVRSQKFRSYFPEIVIKRDKDTKSNFKLEKRTFDKYGRIDSVKMGGNRFSTSVGGTLTGFHGHILLVDDPLDPNRSVSDTELKSANRWVDQTLSTRKIEKLITPTVLIMQRLSQNDPTGHTLRKPGKKIKHICLPGEIRNYEAQLNPPELKKFYKNGLLDPVRMPWSVLDDMKIDLGQYGYAGQVGQKPTPPGGGMFKIEHFHILPFLPRPEDDPDFQIMQILRYWDKAASDDEGDYTVGVKMARLKNTKFLILDVKRGQWATDEREKIMRATAEADGKRTIIYHEQEPGSGGKDSARATITNLCGFSNYAIKTTGNKIYRADPYSVQVNNGNILLLQGEWVQAFKDEHEFFPFGTNDDQVDSASGAFTQLQNIRKASRLHLNLT